jgi:hypothetical protein
MYVWPLQFSSVKAMTILVSLCLYPLHHTSTHLRPLLSYSSTGYSTSIVFIKDRYVRVFMNPPHSWRLWPRCFINHPPYHFFMYSIVFYAGLIQTIILSMLLLAFNFIYFSAIHFGPTNISPSSGFVLFSFQLTQSSSYGILCLYIISL